jgi:hypothetical protein
MKLTREQAESRDRMVAAAIDARAALVEAIDAYNEALRAAETALVEAETAYNDAVQGIGEEIRALGDELVASLDSRSEKWRNSEAGERAAEWAQAYADFDPVEASHDEPSPSDEPDDVADAIGELWPNSEGE